MSERTTLENRIRRIGEELISTLDQLELVSARVEAMHEEVLGLVEVFRQPVPDLLLPPAFREGRK